MLLCSTLNRQYDGFQTCVLQSNVPALVSSTGASAGVVARQACVSTTLYQFTTAGAFTWTAPSAGLVDVLIVGGAGSGGIRHSGGGGAGGVLTLYAYPVTSGTAYSVVVGAGGFGLSYPPTCGTPCHSPGIPG